MIYRVSTVDRAGVSFEYEAFKGFERKKNEKKMSYAIERNSDMNFFSYGILDWITTKCDVMY